MRVIGLKGDTDANVAQALNELAGGRLNNAQTFTLTASAASTTVSVRGLAPTDFIAFDPLTANAATELYGGTMYVLEANRTVNTTTGVGSLVITHANNAQVDRKFRLVWFATA